MLQVLSYQIADSIDIRQFKASYQDNLYYGDSDELFYQTGKISFIYVFKYGVVCFLNADQPSVDHLIAAVTPFCKNPFAEKLSEEFEIQPDAAHNKFGYNRIEVVKSDAEIMRIIMLNVSQSVALDYYYDLTSKLLEETNTQTRSLEDKGSLQISGKHLKKFIGKTINLKNTISENLFIFESPPETWEDENLHKIDLGLKRTFDLQERFRTIEENLQIVKENLELFKDIMQYRNSNLLEWIIIALVFAEVLNIILDKIIK